MNTNIPEISFENGNLILVHPHNFNIDQIFSCGQCFRFNRVDGDVKTYSGVAFSKYLSLSQENNRVTLYNTTLSDWNNVWSTFFDYQTDYAKIISSFSDDKILSEAAVFSQGIRILKQDHWETLCSFIVSQNNNIPRIKGIIENMSARYGTPIECKDGHTRFSFPTPKALCDAGESGLFALKTGFRAKYIYDAASKVENGDIELDKIGLMSLDKAIELLESINGVGPKVAACTLLFGFGFHSAFPIDVWVKRVLATYYSGGVSRHLKGDNAGIAQQYLFYYERCRKNIFI